MIEIKNVVLVDGELYSVDDIEFKLPEGAIVEERPVKYDKKHGYLLADEKFPKVNVLEKTQADILYIAIMTGVEI